MPDRDELALARRCAAAMLARDRASAALGITIDIPAPGAAVARMQVRDDMVNGFGVCHGGLVFALADTAFAFACNAYDRVTLAASASIEFLRPSAAGDELTAHAREDRRDARRGFYTVEVQNGDGDLVALFRGRASAREETLL